MQRNLLGQVRTTMLTYQHDGRRLKLVSDTSALLAFIATAAVSLIVGWWGYAPRGGEPNNDPPPARRTMPTTS